MKRNLRRIWRATLISAVALTTAFSPMMAQVAEAQSGRPRLPVVRDAQIEGLIKDYSAPLLKAAGLSANRVEIILVNELTFNAFVAGQRIFINTGTILNSETPNETIGVLAHEIGHLAGGHQERLRDQMARAQVIAVVASLLGAGMAAAGAAGNSREAAGVGSGIMMSGGGVARRSLMAYQRTEEITADRSALTYLNKTGQSPRGMLESFEGLLRNNILSGRGTDRYFSSHPAPQDRIGFLQTAARESPYFDRKDPPELQLRHDLARAKIAAYNGGANMVRQTFGKDLHSQPALYGDAIATQLSGSPSAALQKIDRLIASSPNTPWFHEVKGEILMERGRGQEAAAAFKRAVQLSPSRSGLLQASIGQALVTTGNPALMKEAIAQIRKGLDIEPNNYNAYRFLAMAYGNIGEVGSAELATAEGYWQAGNFREAKVFAARAQQKFRPGTPSWQQANDIITTR
ncbi:M48 family metallopeptidase [Aureimonas fodinaquatilis]|uniref:M48 family metallopeptidase n=1 Tax=Aureimonas fodinaquatilis TaxID=2565783 RepID=A0A5B0DUY4_9HYPH|nr:M48 family metalloprotease [Aureimonas fodinaquatilis]KAA0970148.1 M48 family metallopeptidase [Aureimonas fodinaquatilis]